MPVVVPLEIPPFHKAKSSPEQWDADFEKVLHNTTAQGYLSSNILGDRMIPARHHARLEEYPNLVRMLCHLQFDVSSIAFSAMMTDDLAAKWLGAPLDVRKKHVLIGIAGACSISSNLNEARLSCAKELRIRYLSTDGRVLLELINAVTPHDLTQEPAHPQYVDNEEWDKVRTAHNDSQNEVVKLALAYILVLRSKLITHVVHFIICSFLGRDLPQIVVLKHGHSHKKATPDPLELFHTQAMHAKYGKRQAEEISAALKAAKKEQNAKRINACRGCNRQATTREIFKRCGACWQIDREVLYCSRECQRGNWKQHKVFCGKPLDYNMAVKVGTSPTTRDNGDDASDVLPPVNANGFKPTIELRAQMLHLKKCPASDYLVWRTNGIHSMITFSSTVAPIFRKHRDNAIESGDRASAALICDCVLWYIEIRKATDFCREVVVDQFSREYRFPVLELEKVLEEMGKFRASVQNRFPALAR